MAVWSNNLYQIVGLGVLAAIVNFLIQLVSPDTNKDKVLDSLAAGVALAISAVLYAPVVLVDAATTVSNTKTLAALPHIANVIAYRAFVYFAALVVLLIAIAYDRYASTQRSSTVGWRVVVLGIGLSDAIGIMALGVVYLFTLIR